MLNHQPSSSEQGLLANALERLCAIADLKQILSGPFRGLLPARSKCSRGKYLPTCSWFLCGYRHLFQSVAGDLLGMDTC
uniref:Uncharacterized protein n=1 Tax=Anopheles atroparvus TaxID=41427 RepID=A0AAG5DTA9_ANOAO